MDALIKQLVTTIAVMVAAALGFGGTANELHESQAPTYTVSVNAFKIEGAPHLLCLITAEVTAAGGVTVEKYIYNFGDGSSPVESDYSSVEYVYPQPGLYMVSVTVKLHVNGEIVEVTALTEIVV